MLQEKEKEKQVDGKREILLTIWIYRVIHFLCVVDFCSYISEQKAKEYYSSFWLFSWVTIIIVITAIQQCCNRQ